MGSNFLNVSAIGQILFDGFFVQVVECENLLRVLSDRNIAVADCKEQLALTNEMYDATIQIRDLARRYRIYSIPNLIIFRDGKILEQIAGAYPKTALEEMILRAL